MYMAATTYNNNYWTIPWILYKIVQYKKAQNSVKFLSAKKKMHLTTLFYIVVLHNVYEHQTKVAFDLMADSCQSSCGSQLLI